MSGCEESMDSGMKVGKLWRWSLQHDSSYAEEDMEPQNVENEISELITSIGFMGAEIAINLGRPTSGIITFSEKYSDDNDFGCPSKLLLMCLNSIQMNLKQQENDDCCIVEDKPFFTNRWGFEFWSCYTTGKDVLEMDGADSKIEKIAWITSTAMDKISTEEKKGVTYNGPFLLYLVPSKDKACEVGRICKIMRSFGIYTLTLHSDASIDRQIFSIKNDEPEFLLSTPERLLELLSSKAIDMSYLSLMVIDGLEAPAKGTYLDAVKSIRQYIPGNPKTVVFYDSKKDSSISMSNK